MRTSFIALSFALTNGIGELTGPIVDGVIGTSNVKDADAIADTLGVANYGSSDNAEDKNALPQQALEALAGNNGILTDVVGRGLGCEQCADLLEGVNSDVDQVGDSLDDIANNILGVCDERTTPSDVKCD
ncbi:hypothetical protein RQP46_006805 [Phenoliferia psychrophenolica]